MAERRTVCLTLSGTSLPMSGKGRRGGFGTLYGSRKKSALACRVRHMKVSIHAGKPKRHVSCARCHRGIDKSG
jgi:hypothetical protein